jgi:uncharacterized membrane protein YkoI
MMASTLPGLCHVAADWSAALDIHPKEFAPSPGRKAMSNATVRQNSSEAVLGGDKALAIAQADAVRAYQDLSVYRIHLTLEDDGWHVDYELKDPKMKGGGPHYLIDARSGAILSKKYEQ